MRLGESYIVLSEFQKWRRGEPPYDWHENPEKNKPLPYDAKKVGEAIDIALSALEEKVVGKFGGACPYREKLAEQDAADTMP